MSEAPRVVRGGPPQFPTNTGRVPIPPIFNPAPGRPLQPPVPVGMPPIGGAGPRTGLLPPTMIGGMPPSMGV